MILAFIIVYRDVCTNTNNIIEVTAKQVRGKLLQLREVQRDMTIGD